MNVTRSRLGSMALLCLYQHRLMSTGQLCRLLIPAARDARYLQRELARLHEDGLADAVTCGSAGAALWFTTADGAGLAEGSRQVIPRPYRMTAARAAGPLKDHMLAVNETGLAFAAAARDRGDTCGPLDWTPEVAHLIRRGQYLICDALVNYVAEDPAAGIRTQLQWFIELDRATMPVSRLAAKLSLYASYRHKQSGSPARGGAAGWRERYPAFPHLLVILTGASEPALERRAADLAAAAAAVLRGRRLAAGVTTLAQLAEAGPFTPIFTPLGGGEGVQCSALLDARRERQLWLSAADGSLALSGLGHAATGLNAGQRNGADICVRYLTGKQESLRYDQALASGW
jgi:Replication-relaxation